MSGRWRGRLAAGAFVGLLAAPAGAADVFYLGLLRAGTDAAARGEHAAAARGLRVACFGLLEEPPLLAQCLVRLALAQSATGDAEAFGETFRRLAEVEERFGAYAAAVPAELRASFEDEVAKRIPPAALAQSEVFGGLAERYLRAELERLPAARRRKEIKRRLKADPQNPLLRTLLAEAQAAPASARRRAVAPEPATAPPEPAAAPTAAMAPPAPTPEPARAMGTQPRPTAPPAPAAEQLSAEASEQLAAARAALARAQRAPELTGALAQARAVAERHPRSREAQHLTAELAYRASRFAEAARYFRRGGPPVEPELLFYYAVSLYESGDRGGAAAALERCLPRLQRTPYVESYAGKILGGAADGS